MMKRLTGRNCDGDAYFENCFYEPCNGEGASERCDDCDFLSDVCENIAHYEELELSLRKTFGDCDGLLDEMVNSFVRHATAEAKEELKGAGKVRILTDEDADKWLRWKELDNDGKLLELPCKPGDTVYVPHRGRIQEMTVTSARIDNFGFWFFEWKVKDDKGVYPWLVGFSCGQIGKYVFLTEQEAKEALEGMKK